MLCCASLSAVPDQPADLDLTPLVADLVRELSRNLERLFARLVFTPVVDDQDLVRPGGGQSWRVVLLLSGEEWSSFEKLDCAPEHGLDAVRLVVRGYDDGQFDGRAVLGSCVVVVVDEVGQ